MKKETAVTLTDKLKSFDFSGGERYTFAQKYDIRDGVCASLLDDDSSDLDDDSADAAFCVKEFGLSYDINSRHYSTVIDGDQITDMVEVTWEFWKTDG